MNPDTVVNSTPAELQYDLQDPAYASSKGVPRTKIHFLKQKTISDEVVTRLGRIWLAKVAKCTNFFFVEMGSFGA